VLEIAFQPDRSQRVPVYRQLESFLRELVESRRLQPGERLPASRELAASLGLSRNSVNQAYQSLTEDGLLRARVGQGTYVVGRPGPAPSGSPPPRAFAWEGLFARRVRALRAPAGAEAERAAPEFDFRAGRVDPGSLPGGELTRAFASALRRADGLVDETDPRGHRPLREAIARGLVARGIGCSAGEVAVVNGAQQAIDLVARVLVDPGDTVVMEQPGYFGAALAFSACEAHVVGVGVDAEGLCTAELARVLRARRVKLLYATPAVQSPTGVSLSPARRRELLALADEYQLPILEDDYDSPLRHGTPPAPALKNLDRAGRVVYVGTFSKTLFAGLRVGYLVAPRPLLERIVLSRFASDFMTDVVTQAALASLHESGALDRHVRRVRSVYAERRAAMLNALATHMPPGTGWTEPAGGNGIWLRLPPDVDAAAVHAGAAAARIAYARGEAFALDPVATGANRYLLLSFASATPSRIDVGVAALASIVRAAGAAPGLDPANGRPA
jgi:GntR family transcriptional regulator/MocR family aminotransferase